MRQCYDIQTLRTRSFTYYNNNSDLGHKEITPFQGQTCASVLVRPLSVIVFRRCSISDFPSTPRLSLSASDDCTFPLDAKFSVRGPLGWFDDGRADGRLIVGGSPFPELLPSDTDRREESYGSSIVTLWLAILCQLIADLFPTDKLMYRYIGFPQRERVNIYVPIDDNKNAA